MNTNTPTRWQKFLQSLKKREVAAPVAAVKKTSNHTEVLEARIAPATLTWVGDVDGNWNTNSAGDTNWDTNTTPSSGDTLIFAGAAVGSLNNDTTGGNQYILQFTAGGYTLTGNSIDLGLSGDDITSSTGTNTVALNLTLSGTNPEVSVSGGTVAISGNLSGGSEFWKSGAGLVVLSGTNTHTNSNVIESGVLEISDFAQLGSGNLYIGAGGSDGTIKYTGGSASTSKIGAFALQASGANNTIEITNAATTLTLTAALGNTGAGKGYTKAGAGALSISVDVTADGPVTISGGKLIVGNGATAGSLTASGSAAVTNNGTLEVNRSDTFFIGNDMTGTGALTQAGTGTLVLTGANSYSGTTTVSAGTLKVGNAGTVGTLGTGSVVNDASLVFDRTDAQTIANSISGTGSVTKDNSNTVTFTGSNGYSGGTSINGGVLALGSGGTTGSAGSGTITIGGGKLAVNRSDAPTFTNGVALSAGGNRYIDVATGTSVTFSGTVSGGGELWKDGAGTLVLSNAGNTHTNSNVINAGTLEIADFAVLGGGNLFIGAGGSGTIKYTGGSASTAKIGAFALQGGGANSTIEVTNAASTLTLTAAVGNNGAGKGFTKAGAGALAVSVDVTHDGPVTISGGSLIVGNGATAGSLTTSGSAAVTNNGSLTVNRSDTFSIGNAITGTGSFVQAGSGTVVFTGTNTYSGSTTVNAGTLLVNGSTAVGSAVTVNNTATLGGSGTVNGTVSVASGGKLAPGTSPGILNSGSVTFVSGATFTAEVNGATAGTQYDRLNVTGSVDLGGATLSTSGTITSSAGQQIILIANDGADAITGTFAGLAEGATVTINSVDFYLSYIGGTGNDVVLSQTSSLVTLSGGNLTFSDTGAGTNDTVTVTLVGANIRVNDPLNAILAGSGMTQIDAFTVEVPAASVTGTLTVTGGTGDDNLTVDFTSGNPIPAGGLTFAGGAGGQDDLTLTGGTTTTVTHSFTNANDGSITLAGALAGTITYTGLEPVTDNLSATDRVFTFTGGAETVTLVDAAGANMTIDSTLGESVTFANPTNSLTIDLQSGADTLTVTSMDAAYAGSLTITSDGGDTATISAGLPTLSALAVTAATINLNSVTTTGTQAYTGAVSLASNTTLASSGSGAINLAGTVNGAFALAVNTSGATTFGGSVGSGTSLTSITTDAGGTTALNAASFFTTGSQILNDAVTLGANVTLDTTGGGAVTVASTLNGGFTFQVNTTGTTTFGGAVGGTTALAGVNITSPGTTVISGGTVTTTGTQFYGETVTLGANTTLTTTNSNVTFNSIINADSATNNRTLSIAVGTGTVAATGNVGASERLGTYTITSAAVANIGRIDTRSGGISVTATTINLNGNLNTDGLAAAGPLTLAGNVNLNTAVTFDTNGSTAGTITVTGGTLALGANQLTVNIANAGTGSISNVISGTAGIDKQGNGTLTLSGANTFTGATTISAGTLSVSGSLSNSTDVSVAASATYDVAASDTIDGLSGAGNVTLGANTLTVGGNDQASADFSGVMSGIGGGLTKTGSGDQILSGAVANTYTGLTSLTEGRLLLNKTAGVVAVPGDLAVGGTGTPRVRLLAAEQIADTSNVTLTIGGGTDAALNQLNVVETIGSLSGTGNVYMGVGTAANLIVGNSSSTTFSGSIRENGNLVKVGSGTLTLSGSNNFTGTTTVNAGVIVVGSNSALGTTAGSTTVASGAELNLGSGITVTGETVTISGGGTAFGGALRAAAGTGTWAGPVILGDAAARVGAAATATLNISGAIQGSGAFQSILISGDAGTGVVTFSAAAGTNTYTGNTGIIRGVLKIGATNSLPTGTVLDVDTANAAEIATFDLNGFNQTVAALQRTNTGGGAGGSSVTNSGGTAATLTVNQTATTTYNGNILAGSGGLALVKSGTGALTLSGANTHAGGTTVSAGTLNVNSIGALGTGGVSVASTLVFNTASITPFANNISGSGAITSASAGNVVLSGNNTFNGTYTINVGNNLIFDSVNALAGQPAVIDNGTLYLGSAYAGGSGTVSSLSGTGGVNAAFGATAGTRTLIVDQTATTTLSGAIVDASGGRLIAITKSGTGTLTLTGTNTYSGGTSVTNGTLNATITPTVNAIGTGAASIGTGATLFLNNTNTSGTDVTISNTFSGAGKLQLNFAAGATARNTNMQNVTGMTGLIQLSNSGATADKYRVTGFTTAAPLQIDSGSQLFSVSGTTNFNGGISVQGTGVETRGAIRLIGTVGGNISLLGDTTIGTEGGTLTGNISSGAAGTQTLTFGTTASVGNATASGIIGGGTGTIALVKTAAGTLTLSGANTFTGGTTMTGGSITAGNNTAFGTAGVVMNSGAARIFVNGNTIANAITINNGVAPGVGLGALTGPGTLGGTIAINNAVTNGGHIDGGTGLIFNGVINAAAGVQVAQLLGTTTFNNSINATGGFGLTGTANWGASDILTNTATVVVGQSGAGTLNLSTFNQTVGAVTLGGGGAGAINSTTGTLTLNGNVTASGAFTHSITGLVNLGGAARTFDVANGTTVNVGAVMSNGGVTKTNPGTLIFTGANTYTGATTISAGTLQIGNGGTTGSINSSSAVANNSTLQFVRTDATSFDNTVTGTGTIRQLLNSGQLTLNGSITNGSILAGSGNSAPAATAAPLIFGGASVVNLTGTLGGTDNAAGMGTFGKLISQSGATISTANLFLGEQTGRTGEFQQDGAAITVTAQMRIGHWPSNTSTFNMNAGTLDLTGTPAGGTEQNGILYVGIDGTGIFNHAGGTVSAAGMVLDNRADSAGTDTYTMTGGTLNIGSFGISGNASTQINLQGGTVRATANWTSGLPMALTSAGSPVTFDTNGFTIGLSGVLSGAGALTKAGSNVLTLSGANSFAGAVAVNAGTLTAGNGAALGSTAAATTVASGATLNINGQNLGAEVVNIAGTGVGGLGALVNNGVDQTQALRFINLTADATVGGTGRFDIRANGGGEQLDLAGFTLTKVGGNQFSIVGANVTNGNLTANAGTLAIETTSTVTGTGTITINSATLGLWQNTGTFDRPIVLNSGASISEPGSGALATVSSPITLNANATINVVGAATTLVLNGVINDGAGSFAITKTSDGALRLAGNNTYDGGTNVNGGTLRIGNGGTSGNAGTGTVALTNGTVLEFLRSDAATFANTISSAGTTHIRHLQGSGEVTLTGTVTASNIIAGGGTNTGDTQALVFGSGSNVTAGYIGLGTTDSGVGTYGKVNILSGATVSTGSFHLGEQSGRSGEVTQTGGDVTVSNTMLIGHWPGGSSSYAISGGTLALTGTSGSNPFTSGAGEVAGTIYLGVDGTGSFTQSGGTVSAQGIVLDNRFGGGGTAGTDTLSVTNGTLNIGQWGIQGQSSSAAVDFGGGTLRATASWNNSLTYMPVNFSAATVVDTNGFDVYLNGGISGAGGITKSNGGILTIAGTASAFTGALTLNGGTTLVNTNVSSAGGAVGVNSSATLGGSGTLNRTVTVNSGANITAGTDGAVGTFTIADLVFNGGTYKADLIGAANDKFAITGTANLNGGTAGIFTLNNAAAGVASGTVFSFIELPGVTAITGLPLTNAAQGSTTTVDTQNATYSYLGGVGGNDFTLTVDGPASIAGTAGNDTFEVRRVLVLGDDVVQTLLGGIIVDSRPAATVGTLTVSGTDGDDTLFINYGGSGGVHNFNTVFNGGNQTTGDSLSIGGASVTTVTHTFVNDNDGSISVVDGAGTRSVTYTGLEPVTDNLNAVNRVFTFTGGAETVTLSDDVNPGDNVSFINSTLGESVTFTNPTGSLTVNLTSGADTLNVEGLDSSFNADLTITGDGSDAVVFQTNDTDLDSGDLSITGGASIAINRTITTTGNVSTAVTGSITDGNAGTVNIVAVDASLSADGGVDADTTVTTLAAASVNNAITIRETDSVALNLVDAGTGTFSLTVVNAVTDNNAGANNVNAGTWTVTAGTGIGAGNSIETTIGTFNATNTTGDIDVTNTGSVIVTGASVTGASGNVNITSSVNIDPAGNITSNAGNVTLTATTGDILGNAGFMVTGASVSLIAGGSIGSAGNNVRTTATALLFTGGATGDVFVTETNGATVTGTLGSGSATLTTTTGDWTINSTGIDAAGGNVTLIASAGDILRSGATADVTGNTLTFTAGGADGDLGVSGTALLTSATSVVFTSTGTGEVFITESNGANVQGTSAGGTITLVSTTGDWTVNGTGVDNTGIVNITATAGDVLRSGGAADITATNLTLTAGGADGDIGAIGTALLTTATQIVFNATGTGDVAITETDGANVTGATTSGAIELITTTGNWNVIVTGVDTSGTTTVTALAGDLTRTGVLANVTGSTVTLNAGGADGDIGVAGTAMLTTATSVVFNGTGTGDTFITESDGANLSGTNGTGIATLVTTTGDWTINSTGVDATGDVNITATAGDILRSGGTADITGATVTLTAGGADGDLGASGNELLTGATSIVFTATGTGEVFLTETDGANVNGTAASGNINLTSTTGNLTVVSTGISTTGNVNMTTLDGDLLRVGAAAIVSGNVLTLTAGGAAGSIGSNATPFLTTATEIIFSVAGTGNVDLSETNAVTLGGTAGAGNTEVNVTAGGDILVNLLALNSTDSVATLVSSGAILDNNGAANNITALGAVFDAANGIGTVGNFLDTTLSNLEANGDSGGVYINEADALTIGGVSAMDGIATALGSISITSGSLTIEETVDNTLGTVTFNVTGTITETGAGLVQATLLDSNSTGAQLLTGANNLDNFAATSTNANITLNEVDGVAINLVNAGTGTVTITLAAGAISDGNGVATDNIIGGNLILTAPGGIDLDTEVTTLTATSTDSDITIREGDDLALNLVNAGAGVVNITAEGAITDNNGALNNIVASGLSFSAGTGINDIETTADSLDAITATNNITINEADDILIGDVEATAGNVTLNVTAGSLLDSNGAGTTNVIGGTLTFTATNGIDLDTDGAILNATTINTAIAIRDAADIALGLVGAGTGNVTLTAVGAFTDNNVAATNVIATALTVTAGTGIDFDTTITTLASADVTGTGDLQIDDLAGGMSVTSATTADGDITLTAAGGNLNVTFADASANVNLTNTLAGDVRVGDVNAGATVTINAFAELDELAPNDGTADITAVDAVLNAGTGIGTNSGGALETALTGQLDATTNTGGILIDNTGTFSVNNVSVATSGNIVINGDEDITVTGTVSSPDDITIHAVELDDAGGPYTNNLTVTGTVTGDNVTLRAGDDVTIDSTGVVTSTGTMEICAGYNDLDTYGAVTLNGTLNIGTGLIICSTGDIVFGPPAAPGQPVINAPGANVTLTTFNGNIYDNNDNAAPTTSPIAGTFVIDVVAAILTLNAPNGFIGETGDTIETTVNTIAATAGAGGLYAWNTAALTVAAVTADGDNIEITSEGSMSVTGPVAELSGADITLFAVGAASDFTLNGTVSGDGNMNFLAGNQVLLGGLAVINNTGALTVSLEAGYPDGNPGLPNNPSADLTISGSLNLGNATLRLTAPRHVTLNGGSADIVTNGSFIVHADRDGTAGLTGGTFTQNNIDSTVQVSAVEITAADVALSGTIDAGNGDIDVFASTITSAIRINDTASGDLNLSLADMLALRTSGGIVTIGDAAHEGTVFIGGLGVVGLGLIDADYTINGGAIDFNGGIALRDDRTLTLNTVLIPPPATDGVITPAGSGITDVTIGGANGTLVINARNDVTLNTRVTNLGASAIEGNFTLNNTNLDLTVTGDVDASTITLTTGTATLTVDFGFTLNSAADGTGNMTITADGIDLDGDLNGGGVLILRGNTAATTMGFGDGSTGSFNMDVTEVGNILDGFARIEIGRTGQTGDIHFIEGIGGEVTFFDPVKVIGGTGTVTIEEGNLAGEDDASFEIDATNLRFEGAAPGITTESGVVDINATTFLAGPTTIDTSVGSGGNVIIFGKIDGNEDFTINAGGAGDVTINGSATPTPTGTSVGGAVALASISITGNSLLLRPNMFSTGDQSYTGADITLVGGNFGTYGGGNITFTGDVTVNSSIFMSAAGFTVTFDGNVDSEAAGNGALILDKVLNATFTGSVGSVEPLKSVRIVATGDVVIGNDGADTFEAAQFLEVKAAELNLDGSVTVPGGRIQIEADGANTALRIGGAEGDLVGGDPTMNISDDDLAALVDGTGSLIFGRTAGTKSIVIAEAGPVTFLDPATVRAASTGGLIEILGEVIGDTADGGLTTRGQKTVIVANVTTAGGNIDIQNGRVDANVTLEATGTGNVTLTGIWSAGVAGSELSVVADAGDITILDTVGDLATDLAKLTLEGNGLITFGKFITAGAVEVLGTGIARLAGRVTTTAPGGQLYTAAVELAKNADLRSLDADGVIQFDSTVNSIAGKNNTLAVTNKLAAIGDLVVVFNGNIGATQRLGTLRVTTTGNADFNGSIAAKSVVVRADQFTVNDVDTYLPLVTGINGQSYFGEGTFLGAITSEKLNITTPIGVTNAEPWFVSGLVTIASDPLGTVSLTNIPLSANNVFGELNVRGGSITIEQEGHMQFRMAKATFTLDLTTVANLGGDGDITQLGGQVIASQVIATAAGKIALDKSKNRISNFGAITAGTSIDLRSSNVKTVVLSGAINAAGGDVLLVADTALKGGTFIYTPAASITASGDWTIYSTFLRYANSAYNLETFFGATATEQGTFPNPPVGTGNLVIYIHEKPAGEV